MNNQAVYNIAEICARHGITEVVISPGSRSAPLVLAFARHPAFQDRIKVVPDERAAAFIGLGLAQATGRPTVLVCTSGSAGLNYAPAVAEAFFQQVPLLVLTADRPPEWIDQLDGQTIRQPNLYGRHAKGSFDFPADTTHPDAKWHAERIINEAINLTQAAPAGPVQVNVPLREPFYPKAGEEVQYEAEVKIMQDAGIASGSNANQLLALHEQLRKFKRIIIVAGQHVAAANSPLASAIAEFIAKHPAPVIADVISNLPGVTTLQRQDVFLAGLSKDQREYLRPDLLITFGQSLISKSLKLFLRDAAPAQHWHIQPAGPVADTFRSLTQVLRFSPAQFFHWMSGFQASKEPVAAWSDWEQAEATATRFLSAFFNQGNLTFTEFSVFHRTLQVLPIHTALHLANSMAVRYANILGLPPQRQTEVFANRGTSGIDGCTSTAVGYALARPDQPVVLLTGDVAFFYDRNAFWHNYPLPNLRVVLFNNHGGGIFRIIDGPRQQPELDEFFETRQPLTAENLCRDFGLGYFPITSFAELDAALTSFFAPATGAAVLEVFTDSRTNAAFFEQYRTAVKAAFS